MLADSKLLLIIVCAIRATAFVAPRQRRGVVLAIRHASEDASVNAEEDMDASVNAEEDVDDAALAASLQVAAKRTSSARDALEKRRRREARPQRAVGVVAFQRAAVDPSMFTVVREDELQRVDDGVRERGLVTVADDDAVDGPGTNLVEH